MLGRAWHDDKVLALQRYLKMPLPHVIGHLEAFWNAAYDNVPRTGALNKRQRECVEAWAMWEGKPGKFYKGLVHSGLLTLGKRCAFIPKFDSNVPDYVRKRWISKDLRHKTMLGKVRKLPEVSGQTGQDKRGVEQTEQEQTRGELNGLDQAGQEQTAGEAPESDPKGHSPDSAPAVAPPVAAETADGANGQVASNHQLVCSVMLERLRKALAQSPPVPVLFLLHAAGMNAIVAKELCAKFKHARIRLAAHYASRQTTSNVAGLLRSAIEHEGWDLT